MKRINFKAVQVLSAGCLSLVIALSQPIRGTMAFAALDSVGSSHSMNVVSVNNGQTTNGSQPTSPSEVSGDLALGIAIVFGLILLLIALSRNNSSRASNSAHPARRSSRSNSDSLGLWSTMQADNNLNSSMSSDSSSSSSNSSWGDDSSSSDSGDCGGGGSWGGDSDGSSSGGGDCGGDGAD